MELHIAQSQLKQCFKTWPQMHLYTHVQLLRDKQMHLSCQLPTKHLPLRPAWQSKVGNFSIMHHVMCPFTKMHLLYLSYPAPLYWRITCLWKDKQTDKWQICKNSPTYIAIKLKFGNVTIFHRINESNLQEQCNRQCLLDNVVHIAHIPQYNSNANNY